MYPRNLPLVNNNLKIGAEIYITKKSYFTKTYFRAIEKIKLFDTCRIVKDVRNKLYEFIKKKQNFIHQQIFPRTTRSNIWKSQCECVLTRRKHQMFNLYTKIFEEKNFKNFLSRMKVCGKRRSKEIMLGSVSLLAFEWDKYRIAEKELRSHINDLTYVYTLREKTLCQGCNRKNPLENTENICHCDDYKSPDPPLKFDNWETFIEKKDLVVWRRLHESGHYEYKVYGSYNDVSAEEFLNVQVDTTYRRMWDTTAIVLDIVEQDPDVKTNSDIIYWEMLWPMMFTNRDYVFQRRYLVDYKTKTILMASKSITHPKCPERSDKFRVKDYWSYMVIRPYTELNKHGIEFVLTYYDNPGVSIPSKVTTWVAMRAMPDFLERLRDAAKKYKAYCKQYGVKCICLLKEDVSVREEEEREDSLYYFLDSEEDLITDNTITEAQHNLKKRYLKKQHPEPPKPEVGAKNGGEGKQKMDTGPATTTAPTVQRGTKAFWKYLYPSYYIS